MRVISRKRLKDFWRIHAQAKIPLCAWYADITTLDIQRPADIRAFYASARFLRDNRVIFNIGGNKYRLIVKINKSYSVAFVCFVGTHAEYDKIDAAEI